MALSGRCTTQPSRLIGRSAELSQIDHAVSRVSKGDSEVLTIVGEAGIGKTSLLGALCERAGAAKLDVLSVSGSEFEREVPFAMISDALDNWYKSRSATVAASSHYCPEDLAPVLPSLLSGDVRRPSHSEAQRHQTYRAVRSLLRLSTPRNGLLLALDNVHWADQATTGLVCYLLRHPVPGLLLALAFRPAQVPRQILHAMHRTGASSVARVLRLAPLTIEEAAQFVGSASASVLVRSIHAQSGGNPYFLEQLSRAVQLSPPSPTAVPNETDEVDVPDALRRAVGLELDRLSPGGLAVLQACSVIGGPFDVDLLAEITRLDRTAVLTFVDELVTHDLLEATAEAKSLRFRHPVVKRAVYDGLSPGKRIDAHWRVANWLADKGAPLVDRAHHIEHSAAFGDEAAVAALADAAHVVSAYAPATAVGWYRAALKLLPDTAGTDRRLPLELSLAGALASAGLLHDSRVALDRMLTRLPRIASDRLPIIRMIARAEHGLGRSENARQLLLDALGHVPVGSTEFVPLQLALAENNLMTRRWNRAIDAARQAITEATAMGDPSVLLSATSRLAWCTGYAAATTEARSLIDTATMQLNALEAQADPRLLEALGDLVNAEIAVDRFRIADTHVQRGLRLAHDSGQRYAFGYFALGAVATKLFVGNLQGARAAAAGAIEAARSLDNDQLLVAAQSLRCWNEIQLGNISVALSAGRSAVEIAERTRGGLFSWLAHVCYGDALIESGEFARGRQEIISACGAELVHIPPAARPIWQFALVTAELALGVRSVAIARTRQMEATAGVSFSRRGYAHLCRSRIQLAEGNPVAAAASALRAVDCFDEADMRLWSARARLVCGQAHARAGSMAEAVRELEIAHGVLHEAAATRLRDEAARELRALGQRVRPGRPTVGAAVSSHCRLSARERGIADLVSQGLTNRQIADQLFISAKTVEKHLARVFTKLGVSTRAAVAAAVSQQRAEDG